MLNTMKRGEPGPFVAYFAVAAAGRISALAVGPAPEGLKISDPFQNLRIGVALIRTKYKDAKAMSTYHMLHLHALSTAEVFGVADKVGSLEVGKFADFILVDPRAPDTGPVHDVIGTYVLACGLRNLKQVYVGGELIADGERLPKQDESVFRREVDTRIARLAAENRLTLAMP